VVVAVAVAEASAVLQPWSSPWLREGKSRGKSQRASTCQRVWRLRLLSTLLLRSSLWLQCVQVVAQPRTRGLFKLQKRVVVAGKSDGA
jgi:hypothetical protein